MHQALETLRRLAGLVDDPGALAQPEALIRLLAAQLGVLGAGATGRRGLVARVALGGQGAEPFGILLDGISGLARTRATIEDEIGRFGGYTLLRKLSCSAPEECFLAATHGDRDRDVFLRTFPRSRLDDALVARLRSWSALRGDGAAQLHDFGVVEHRPYLVSDRILGTDLVHARALRPSLPLVLAWIAEGLDALEQIHGEGQTHGHLTPGRIRIEPLGNVKLCLGTSELPVNESAGADLCTLVRLLLEPAIDDPKLIEVLRTDDREALVVAADRLVELHPELDELVPAIMWKRAPADEIVPLLIPHLSRETALALIGGLVESARA